MNRFEPRVVQVSHLHDAASDFNANGNSSRAAFTAPIQPRSWAIRKYPNQRWASRQDDSGNTPSASGSATV